MNPNRPITVTSWRPISTTTGVTYALETEQDGRALVRDGLTGAELRDALVLLIFGGFDTTRNQLGLAMQVFLEHTAQWRLLGEHPELGAAAVEEVMRVRPIFTRPYITYGVALR